MTDSREPTKEEWEELLKLCGFWFDGTFWVNREQTPDKMHLHVPPLDYNSLFAYVVPVAVGELVLKMARPGDKALSQWVTHNKLYSTWVSIGYDANALFWTCWEVIHGD